MNPMNIYLFGNEDVKEDSAPFRLKKAIESQFPHMSCFIVKPNEDLPFIDDPCPILIDTVYGISTESLFDQSDRESILLSPRNTVHDFDLGFQLKYLYKIGELKKWYLIGIPGDEPMDQDRVISILRKLVEQDIQGS